MKSMKINHVLVWLVVGFIFWFQVVGAQARIAFVNPEGQLATVNPDGSDMRVLSNGDVRYQFPAWSPDGSKLAAIGVDLEAGFLQIFKDEREASATEIYRSRTEAPFYMYWAPNSQDIAFLANHASGTLALRTVSETNADKILAFGSPFYWQWSSDSQMLFIHTGFNSASARLGFSSRVRDTLGNNSIAPAGRFQAPGISASANYIAYATEDSRGTYIVLQNNARAFKEEVKRELPHLGIAAMSWSPEDDLLAIMSPERDSSTYFGPIRLLDAESGLLEPLSTQRAFAFFWSPDGRYIVYFAAPQGGGELASTLEHASLETVQLRSMSINLIDITAKTDKYLSDFVPSPLFVNQFLPFFDQYALSHHIWSPESDALVLPAVIANQINIMVLPLNAELSLIAQGDTPFWNQP